MNQLDQITQRVVKSAATVGLDTFGTRLRDTTPVGAAMPTAPVTTPPVLNKPLQTPITPGEVPLVSQAQPESEKSHVETKKPETPARFAKRDSPKTYANAIKISAATEFAMLLKKEAQMPVAGDGDAGQDWLGDIGGFLGRTGQTLTGGLGGFLSEQDIMPQVGKYLSNIAEQARAGDPAQRRLSQIIGGGALGAGGLGAMWLLSRLFGGGGGGQQQMPMQQFGGAMAPGGGRYGFTPIILQQQARPSLSRTLLTLLAGGLGGYGLSRYLGGGGGGGGGGIEGAA